MLKLDLQSSTPGIPSGELGCTPWSISGQEEEEAKRAGCFSRAPQSFTTRAFLPAEPTLGALEEDLEGTSGWPRGKLLARPSVLDTECPQSCHIETCLLSAHIFLCNKPLKSQWFASTSVSRESAVGWVSPVRASSVLLIPSRVLVEGTVAVLSRSFPWLESRCSRGLVGTCAKSTVCPKSHGHAQTPVDFDVHSPLPSLVGGVRKSYDQRC